MTSRLKLSPDAAPVAHEVYNRMRLAGLTQKSLAVAAGLNETYVRDLFSGRSQNPKSEHLAKLADALRCQVADLIRPISAAASAEDIEFAKPADLLPLRPAEVGLIRLFRVLDQPERDALIDMAAELMSISRHKSNDVS